jgi:hypothetical protein
MRHHQPGSQQPPPLPPPHYTTTFTWAMSAAATYAPSPRPVTPPPAAPSEPRFGLQSLRRSLAELEIKWFGLVGVGGGDVNTRAMMQMGAQPPARTVYQRALKPSPCVYFVVPALPAVGASREWRVRVYIAHPSIDHPPQDEPKACILAYIPCHCVLFLPPPRNRILAVPTAATAPPDPGPARRRRRGVGRGRPRRRAGQPPR